MLVVLILLVVLIHNSVRLLQPLVAVVLAVGETLDKTAALAVVVLQLAVQPWLAELLHLVKVTLVVLVLATEVAVAEVQVLLALMVTAQAEQAE